MVPATPQTLPQQQQQQQQQETPVAQDDYHSDWTGDAQATDTGDEAGFDDKFIAGQSLIDDTHNIDRQVARTTYDVARPTPIVVQAVLSRSYRAITTCYDTTWKCTLRAVYDSLADGQPGQSIAREYNGIITFLN